MNNKNENENVDISNNNETSEEKNDIISKILKKEEEFISLIKKLLNSNFEELFPKILNLPKIDFLNQLTSNVSYILTEQFSSEIFDNDKSMSIITSTCRNFDKIYNKYMEELTEGWDQYNYEKINQIQNPLNENIETFYYTKFRKHCHKTQHTATHLCNKNGETGNFIIVFGPSDSSPQPSKNSGEKIKNKLKYLICDNCRKTFFVHEFDNYCEFCKITYLCGPLIKDEDENIFPAALNPPHCENFVNEELQCEKCKNKLFIDIRNSKLFCGNKDCDYYLQLENNKKYNFKCKTCHNDFYSSIKIYNPLELVHFKEIINKALLYKRKAYPGKLSCCKKIKEKKTDFFHKKDCRGNLYFAEYNKKIFIICSKCKAANQYSKFIWTCPECGLHFRDKKSEENEMKVRKTKSSNRLIKSKKLFPNFEDENFLTLNDTNNKRSFAEILNKRKEKYEKKTLYSSYNNLEESITERKRNSKLKFLSEKKINETDSSIDKSIKTNEVEGNSKKKKRRYIIGKILPFSTPRKKSFDTEGNNNTNNDSKSNETKKEYYDKKVNDLIQSDKTSKEKEKNEDHMYLCKSGRVHFKYGDESSNSRGNNEDKSGKNKNIYVRNFDAIEGSKSNYNSVRDQEKNKFENTQSTIEINSAFNKKKSPDTKNIKKDNNDLKCKKFVPIKLRYLCEQPKEKEIEIESENNKIENSDNKIYGLFESQRIKNQIELKINGNINIENKSNNKESWQSKETTTKGSIESKNSIFSHSPQKEEEEENKKNHRSSFYFNNNNNCVIIESKELEKKRNVEKEDDIIPFEMVDPDQDIIIEDKNIKEDKSTYNHIQRRLKKILLKGRLPRFDLDNFSIDKQIGDGSFGVIYLVHNNKTRKKYAMKKIIANTINSLEVFQKEFEIAHHNRHPSILDIKGIYMKCFDSTTFGLYVLMDLAERDWEVEINEREKHKKYYKENELISILKQLSSALFFLQKEKRVAHRDIKPENVLIFRNKNKYGELFYKLCDFGEAQDYAIIHNKKQKTLRGTELYMSPALYNGLLNEASYVDHDAYKSDVFSLGCCLIIAANLDFEIINEIRALKEQNKIDEFLKKKLLGKYSQKFIDVISKMINFNEKERIDFIRLQEIIENTF